MISRIRAVFTLVTLVTFSAANAQEYVSTNGRLSDDQFYKLVSCAAAPGAKCKKPVVKWSKRNARRLTVGITRIDPGIPTSRVAQVEAAAKNAIAELNASGAGIHLEYSEKRPKLPILMLDVQQGAKLQGTRISGLDGNTIDAAYVHIWWNNGLRIQRGAIVISTGLHTNAIKSTVLEEITQGLGFLTDIKNPYYTNRSIFSENGVSVTQIKGQDLMAIRRHYP
ncbi:MAG: DUF2927 domain-containing protein [Shimia sp.]|uniref:DUF2927 domain-containing protein n=1 Tax=Shimia sp. TaxID=1954381 RepID=UPI003B8D2F9C